MSSKSASSRRRPLWRRLLHWTAVFLAAVALLFTLNGLFPGWEDGEEGTTAVAAADAGRQVRVLAFNIAKCFQHLGGLSFADPDDVRARLDGIAELIREHRVDIACISEIVKESPPCPVDQVTYLAEKAGMHAWAFGENYSWGLPFLRLRAGNALLSRFPLRVRSVDQLAGGTPFWDPTNNRRILWCEVLLGEEWLSVASVRNDSFDPENNAVQAREILDALGRRPALLGGDFNARPDTKSMRLFRNHGFAGRIDGPLTYPARDPDRRIDYVLAPASWTLIEERVLTSDLSDHLPVLATFRR